ncbi:uncharacterized protein LOC105160530 [Sesamum indicum]|uniref:Uncharacterized protein LOC105160530 n=1 Tax=Sesamum indicum TaxID=4182 RepID=A0A6I9T0E5_SESIN|nr:uncharacterized protein LOC105160530 [Sesamum indicum]
MANYLSSALKLVKSCLPIADASSWYCAIVLLALIILIGGSVGDQNHYDEEAEGAAASRGKLNHLRPCDEIYVVGEGETLHTISDKCGDPFIVERNPHIHDPDDVFPGLVIKITPSPYPSML